jgi:hypothetical protein
MISLNFRRVALAGHVVADPEHGKVINAARDGSDETKKDNDSRPDDEANRRRFFHGWPGGVSILFGKGAS